MCPWCGLVITAVWLSSSTAVRAQPASLVVDPDTLHPGRQAFGIRLFTTADVADVAVELRFPEGMPVGFTINAQPACVLNAALNKPDSSVEFTPPDCAPGVDCDGLRVHITAQRDRDAIASGSTLVSCFVFTATPPDAYPLRCVAAEALSPGGRAVDIGCDDTRLIVEAGAALVPEPGHGLPGDEITIDLALQANTDLGSVVTDLQTDAVISVAADGQQPRCGLNDALPIDAEFAFRPTGCTPASDCTAVRVNLASADGAALQTGLPLFHCTLALADDALAGFYPLRFANSRATDSAGAGLPFEVIGATVEVLPLIAPAQTPTAMAPASGGDGCQVGAPRPSDGGWLLAAALLAPLTRRWRRNRCAP
ncbi:MAG: hypothetical protein SF182_06930 [Deltaproteobacteria bacterium]|nr:hypothetical protein [Deltaproteobacteria bacterium]